MTFCAAFSASIEPNSLGDESTTTPASVARGIAAAAVCAAVPPADAPPTSTRVTPRRRSSRTAPSTSRSRWPCAGSDGRES